MNIHYRPACADDLDEICQLASAAAAHMQTQGIDQWDSFYPLREDFAEDLETGSLYVGTAKGHIVVTFAVNQCCDADYAAGAWRYPEREWRVIHRLCVHPDAQHQGVGRQTMAYLEQLAGQSGALSIRLDVFSGNPFALGLYRSLGFVQVGAAELRKGRFLLMEKYL